MFLLILHHDLPKNIRRQDRIQRDKDSAARTLSELSRQRRSGQDYLHGQREGNKHPAVESQGVSPATGGRGEFPSQLLLRRETVGGTPPTGRHSHGGGRTVRPAPVAGNGERHRDISEPHGRRHCRCSNG